MVAYNECYIADAQSILGGYFEYMTHDIHYQMDEAFEMLANSRIGRSFGRGNPKYVAGLSGAELARKVLYEVLGVWPELVEPTPGSDKNIEYWVGWILAQYQRTKNVSFRYLIDHGLTASRIASRYILHESDLGKFREFADRIVDERVAAEEAALKRIRKACGLTQKQLAERAGVSLRMIQLYEQKQADINKAQVNLVKPLAEVLGCTVEDLTT